MSLFVENVHVERGNRSIMVRENGDRLPRITAWFRLKDEETSMADVETRLMWCRGLIVLLRFAIGLGAQTPWS